MVIAPGQHSATRDLAQALNPGVAQRDFLFECPFLTRAIVW